MFQARALLRMRNLGIPLTRKFFAQWCHIKIDETREVIEYYRDQKIIEKCGMHGQAYLYRPGDGARHARPKTITER